MGTLGIIEIDKCINKYKANLIERPRFVICGSILINNKWHGGILTYVKCEFWGKIICKICKKYGGEYTVERTEFHENGETYFERCSTIFDSITHNIYGYVIIPMLE